MKIELLEDLDQLSNESKWVQNQWITAISDRDLYKIATWLLVHLGPNRFQTNHERTRMLDICQQYNHTGTWSEKQKFYIGGGVIAFWDQRQIEKDPRNISHWY